MTRILQKLLPLFRMSREQRVTETTFNKVLNEHFVGLRNADTDTHRQWLRLRRTLAEGQAEVHFSKPRIVARFVVALSTVAVIICGYIYFTSTHVPLDRFATGKGEQKEIHLSDGSQVMLNYATELVVQEIHKKMTRRLSLSGEAYFRVQGNGTSFIVSTRYGDVQVIGTEFNLCAREGVLEVGVNKGVVKVSVLKDGRDSALLLTEHQTARCFQNDFPQRTEGITFREYPGWMYGKLVLDKVLFQTACQEIELRFNVAIIIEDDNIRNERITGILDARTSESALKTLCELTGKRYTHEGQIYHIY